MKKFDLLHWTPEMVKSFWDYESQFPENFFAYRFGDEIIRKLFPYLPAGGNVLDYGCGPGNLLEKLLDRDLNVAGLDFSPAAKQIVIQRFRDNKNFIGAFELKEVGKWAASFDAVIVIEVIEHLYDSQLDELLSNIQTLLRPGGVAIFTTPNEEVLENAHILCPTSGQLFHRWQHVRNWSSKSVENYLTNHDFQIEKSFTTDFCITFHTDNMKAPLKQKLTNLKKMLKFKFNPGKKRPHLVAIARKPVIQDNTG
ncbi:SAM-dependent methyltransferases [hydrothermal vent metagenome]|uniref:SAM-dependent methyltransferases n=1 Tax=hydrothermal vent metagenome TaxID=652676 RepID=A0A3B0YP81_9ZZZZ